MKDAAQNSNKMTHNSCTIPPSVESVRSLYYEIPPLPCNIPFIFIFQSWRPFFVGRSSLFCAIHFIIFLLNVEEKNVRAFSVVCDIAQRQHTGEGSSISSDKVFRISVST